MIYQCTKCSEPVSNDIAPVLENGVSILCKVCTSNLAQNARQILTVEAFVESVKDNFTDELMQAYALNEYTSVLDVIRTDARQANELELQFIEIGA